MESKAVNNTIVIVGMGSDRDGPTNKWWLPVSIMDN